MGYEDQLQFLGSTMNKMLSLGASVPRGMVSRIAKTRPGVAGTYDVPYGAGSFRVPAKLKISPNMRYTSTQSQLSTNVHELGHADDSRNISRGAPRRQSESRAVAYEELFGPIVMRALGSPVPNEFWRELASHAYRKEFGTPEIEKQKAFLRSKFGAALYDREDARVLQRAIPKVKWQTIRFEDGTSARVRVPSAAEESAAERAFQRRRAYYESLKRKNPRPVPPPYRGRS